ncbi:MAG: tyrosine-type recombinase/integrase [Acidimicrobiia bacterium]|nr:tyrosine-type recombinase/integrase [Acidimicrobiia bacterium]
MSRSARHQSGTFSRSFYRVPERPDPEEQEDPPCKDTSPASAIATTPSSMKGSTRSPARNGAAGIPPAPTAPEAAALVARLAAERDGRNDEVRSLTFGAYLTHHWLPRQAPRAARQHSSQLRPQDPAPHPPRPGPQAAPPAAARRPRTALQLDAAAQRRHRALAPKTVYEVHLIIRGALDHALRRGLVTRNVALAASAPKLRAIPKTEQKTWTADELQAFLRGCGRSPAVPSPVAVGQHRDAALRAPRAEVVRPRRGEEAPVDQPRTGRSRLRAPRITRQDRQLPALHRPRPDHLAVLAGWRTLQAAEFAAVGIDDPGWMFTSAPGGPVHPHSISQTFDRIVRRAPVPVIPFHGLRHTHASLLIANDVDAKVAPERLGHSEFVFTVQSYQHTFPGMHTDAARVIEALLTPRATENPKLAKAG